MTIERFIFIAISIISISSVLYIPKEKARKALLSFMVFQATTWLVSIILVQSGKTSYPVTLMGIWFIVVELGWIEYPVREFHKANATSFTFEYIVLPLICIFFNLYFPENKGLYKKTKYYITFLTIFTLIEYTVEKYTLIIKYVHWEWYTTFITMGMLIYFVRSVYKWFFNLNKPFPL
jgi:hypothetical protein